MATQKSTTSQTKRPTSVSAWKKKANEPTELPSGNYARIRVPGMDFFLSAGFIPNSLRAVVSRQIAQMETEQGKKAKAADPNKELSDILQDEEKLLELLAMYDKIVAHCMTDPKVELPPDDPADRDDSVLYTDELDMDDKVFIFNVAVGGTKDLESFRREQGKNVESVRAGAEVADATE